MIVVTPGHIRGVREAPDRLEGASSSLLRRLAGPALEDEVCPSAQERGDRHSLLARQRLEAPCLFLGELCLDTAHAIMLPEMMACPSYVGLTKDDTLKGGHVSNRRQQFNLFIRRMTRTEGDVSSFF
jgi:hypothetical protein